MKKIIVLLLVVLSLGVFTGCSSNNEAEQTSTTQNSPKEEINTQQTISWTSDGVISQNEYKNSKNLVNFPFFGIMMIHIFTWPYKVRHLVGFQ